MSNRKQCQSCGMPLQNKKGDHRGSEKDGTKSEKYCKLCYRRGKFINPNLTRADMEKIVDKVLKENGWIGPMRWLAKKQLPKLERWKAES